ncbi:MAG TPA: TIGR02147 family protein, partial [Chitinispirillaceae bacterium]|nr:TIGR02147 family protein [Chitinispirillaceae bacterium]
MMQRIEFYDDFRNYLRDYYADQKLRFPSFSYRYFCRKAGLSSPSHFIEIIDGKRKLTSKMLDSFIKGLALTENDARYFTTLVNFNQSKNSTEKQQLLLQMRGMKRKVKQALISTDYYEYYSKWYNIIIRELACIIDWHDDYDLLSKSIVPSIKKNEARESVEF